MSPTGSTRGHTSRGVSLPEVLVVVAVLALVVLVALPLAASRLREAKLRNAAQQFTTSLRAARMIAVTVGRDAVVTVSLDPVNAYDYIDAEGRARRVDLPPGVRIATSPASIRFRPNGSVQADSAPITVFEATFASGGIERWTVETSLSGLPAVSHLRLDSGSEPSP